MEGIVSAILNQPADMPTSYGVEIPNTDGRAGMIAIPVRDESEVDLDKLQAIRSTCSPFWQGLLELPPTIPDPVAQAGDNHPELNIS